MLATLERTETSSGVVDALFSRSDSRRAASTFLRWFFRQNSGRATKQEMSTFSRQLASGALGCRLSRANFYGSILKKFLNLGLISVNPSYDHKRRRVIPAYTAVVQAIPKRRPPTGSLIYRVHVFAELWNRECAIEA